MKNELFTETPSEREARLARFRAMTDEENEVNIASDPDAQTPRDMEFLKRGSLVSGDRQVIIPIALELSSFDWLREHHIDLQVLVSGMIQGLAHASKEGS